MEGLGWLAFKEAIMTNPVHRSTSLSQAWTTASASFAVILMLVNGASAAPKLKVLHTFTGGSDGANPSASLLFDTSGNLYGTTQAGGTGTGCGSGCGTVFQLTRSGNSWTEHVLYSFSGGSDGSIPTAGLVADAAGNLYGTTFSGGSNSCACGVVFELVPQSGGGWTESVLHSFGDTPDGANVYAPLIFDTVGNLYGTTLSGGNVGMGVIYKLTPSNGSWTESVLHSFCSARNCADGASPYAGLIFDTAGNLYGTTVSGGIYQVGTVFKLKPHSGGSWTEATIYDFTGGNNGEFPNGGVIFDAKGNLYGMTQNGGTDDVGVVYKLKPSKGVWNISVLHSFTGGGSDGGDPAYGPLAIDRADNLYGTTTYGGLYQYGTAFKLIPAKGGKWKETVLYSFSGGRDGGDPYAGLILGAGNLYGTTTFGGNLNCGNGYGCGTVLQLTP
jgi:uncharacterized repeat protein (TIGR03803 family)